MDENTRNATRQWTVVQPIVSAFVASVVQDFSARDDVLQEIAVAVLESFKRFDPQRPFIAWALGIAQNQVGLYLRRVRRDRLVFDELTISNLVSAFSEISIDEYSRLDHLRDCLTHLEGRDLELCNLRYRHDFKPAAIASSIGVSANTVAKALQRIRDQLRQCVERKSTLETGTR